MTAKKTRKTQVSTARLIIAICAIALAFGALFLNKTGFTILHTQWNMYSYWSSINEANNQHDYFYNMARQYPMGGYMHSAEEWDNKAEAMTKERANFVANATDSTVIWASRNGVELLTILAGAVELLIGIAMAALSGYLIFVLVTQAFAQKHHRVARRNSDSRRTHCQARSNSSVVASYRTR